MWTLKNGDSGNFVRLECGNLRGRLFQRNRILVVESDGRTVSMQWDGASWVVAFRRYDAFPDAVDALLEHVEGAAETRFLAQLLGVSVRPWDLERVTPTELVAA